MLGVVLGEAAVAEVRGVELDRHGEAVGRRRAGSPHSLEQRTGTTGDVAAPLVGAAVDVRGEELREEVSVGGVHLHAVEPGLLDQAGGRAERGHDLLDLARLQGTRAAEEPEHRHGSGGVARGDRPARDEPVGLAARVVELGDHRRARGGVADSREPAYVEVPVGDDVATALEVAAVDHQVAGDQEPAAALGPAAVEPLVPHGRLVVAVGEVLGHRGLGDAVGQGQAAGQGERFVDARHADVTLGRGIVSSTTRDRPRWSRPPGRSRQVWRRSPPAATRPPRRWSPRPAAGRRGTWWSRSRRAAAAAGRPRWR